MTIFNIVLILSVIWFSDGRQTDLRGGNDHLDKLDLTILLPQPRDELLRRDDAHFLLLRGNGVKEVRQAREQVLLLLLLGFVGQHVLPERPAEVESLKHRVTVTRVSKLWGEDTEACEQQRGLQSVSSGLSAKLTGLRVLIPPADTNVYVNDTFGKQNIPTSAPTGRSRM